MNSRHNIGESAKLQLSGMGVKYRITPGGMAVYRPCSGLDSTLCGPNSPFLKITEMDAKIVMIRCGLEPNTTMHALEELLNPPYLLGDTHLFTLTDWIGRTSQKKYVTHNFHGVQQRHDRVEGLLDPSSLRRGKVLDADTCIIDAPVLRKNVVPFLTDNPWYFVDKENL